LLADKIPVKKIRLMKALRFLIIKLNISLNLLISNINKFQFFIEKRFLNENKLGFEDLTPNINETEIKKNQKTYLESIKWAIQNKNIKNVALTGFYGTGKSTILNSFIKKNKGIKYLLISLSKFDDNDYKENEVEVAILQQIFYSKKQNVLSDSRLKRIKNNKYLFLKAVGFCVWIISCIYILLPNLISTFIFKNETLCDYLYKYFPNEDTIAIPLIFLFIVGLFIIFKTILKEVLNLKLNKLSVKDLELIPKEDKDNLFNKNIDEIIYFFEKTKVEVVIIEDLDRFNEPSILIKLREINSLINNCEDIENKVTFIYAIKDEMFSQDNNRAKFFDFIIPLIPIINYDNSYEILTEKLSGYNDIKDDFLKNISSYINDMRTLKNIVNEFKVYQNILNENKKNEVSVLSHEASKKTLGILKIQPKLIDLSTANSDKSNENMFDNQKLLSLIIYKNYYPKDFTLVQLQQGILYSIFKQKENLHNNIIAQKEQEIIKITKEIEVLDSEKIDDIHTLRKIYLYELYKKINTKVGSNVKQILDKGITLKDDSLLTNDNFAKLIKSSNIEVCNYDKIEYWDSNKDSTNISFKDIEKQVNNVLNYSQRENIIEDKTSNKIFYLEIEKYKLQKDIKEIKYSDLSQSSSVSTIIELKKYINNIINKSKLNINKDNLNVENDDKRQDDEKNHDYNLLKTLVIEGYIDEHYIDYISYFYKGSLSVNDNNLKKKIIEQKIMPFDTKIDNVRRLVEKLAESNFKKHSILNHKILEYLLDGEGCEKLDILIVTISERDTLIFDFIKSYLIYLEDDIVRSEKIKKFIKTMLEKNFFFWEFLCENDLEKKIKDKVLINILKIGSNDNLTIQNSNNSITDYINLSNDFLEIFKEVEDEDKLIKTLENLDVKFISLDYFDNGKSLFEKIYKYNLYDINPKMIFEILNFKKTYCTDNNLKYTDEDINNSNYTTIIESNIPELINYINDNIKDYIENVFLKLETNNNESEETIIKLLNNNNVNITIPLKIEIIKKQNKKISEIEEIEKYLWDDIIENNKLQPIWKNILIYFENFENFDFLENYLNQKENFTELSKDFINNDNFIKNLTKSRVSKESFNCLLNSINKTYDDISILETSNSERILALVKAKKVNLTNKNLQYIYNSDKDDERIYITYIELNEKTFIGSIDEFTLNETIIYNLIINSTLSKESKNKIISQFDSEIALYSSNYLKDIGEYLSSAYFVNYSTQLYNNLMGNSGDISIQIELLAQHFHTLQRETIIKSLEVIGEPFSKIQKKQKFEVINNPDNLKLLNLLKGTYIKTIHPKKNGNLSVTYYS